MLNNIVTTVLMREGKISLPSIGILVKADFDGDTTYLFTPTAAKSDSNIIAEIIVEMNVTTSEAINILDSYIEFIKSVVAKNGKYNIKNVGDLLCNSNHIFFFMPLNSIKEEILVEKKEEIVEEVHEEIIEEIREEIITNEVVVEEVEDTQPEPQPELQTQPVLQPVLTPEPIVNEDSSERLNERFQSKRLGEIIDGGANKRFYDKVHSQVLSASESVTSPVITEESPNVKRKGLYDIYDKGVVKKEAQTNVSQPVITTQVPIEQPTERVTQTPAPSPVFVENRPKKKKKVDLVLIISIIVIIVGLAFIGYFYFLQQSIEL